MRRKRRSLCESKEEGDCAERGLSVSCVYVSMPIYVCMFVCTVTWVMTIDRSTESANQKRFRWFRCTLLSNTELHRRRRRRKRRARTKPKHGTAKSYGVHNLLIPIDKRIERVLELHRLRCFTLEFVDTFLLVPHGESVVFVKGTERVS